MTAMNKRQLRKQLRALDEGKAAREAQSAAICRHILASALYQDAWTVGGYMPMPHEADILSVLQDVLQSGKRLALPLCGPAPHMTFRLVTNLDELVPGAYGLLEPAEEATIVPADGIDLLLVPLEGIDTEGFRIGKGGGYYDRMLAECAASSVGCAFTWQQVRAVPRDVWDKPLAFCADSGGLKKFSR